MLKYHQKNYRTITCKRYEHFNMQSFKDLLNKAVHNSDVLKELSPRDSAALKRCLLDIYKAVANVCDRYHLTYMFAGGSCLGAIRHQGFIPWDDDLDLLMPRTDYNKLIALCEKGELGDNFIFTYPNKKTDAPTMFLKIYMKGTLMKGIIGGNSQYPQECFIDIFPIDGFSNSSFARKYKGIFADSLRLIANTVAESKKMSEEEKKLYSTDKQLMNYVKKRRIIGKLFSIIPHKQWIWWYEQLVSNNSKTGLLGIPTGRMRYNGEVFSSSVYLPTTKGIFEGIEVNLPAKTDIYLKNLYHNYMELPPEEKRERHFFTQFYIPEQYYQRD